MFYKYDAKGQKGCDDEFWSYFLIYSPLKANYYKFRVIYYKILQLQ